MTMQTDDPLVNPIEKQTIPVLYTPGPDIDHAAELRRLKAALFNKFADLLGVVSDSAKEKVRTRSICL